MSEQITGRDESIPEGLLNLSKTLGCPPAVPIVSDPSFRRYTALLKRPTKDAVEILFGFWSIYSRGSTCGIFTPDIKGFEEGVFRPVSTFKRVTVDFRKCSMQMSFVFDMSGFMRETPAC
jgi:hypothetical protein